MQVETSRLPIESSSLQAGMPGFGLEMSGLEVGIPSLQAVRTVCQNRER